MIAAVCSTCSTPIRRLKMNAQRALSLMSNNDSNEYTESESDNYESDSMEESNDSEMSDVCDEIESDFRFFRKLKVSSFK